MENKLKVTLRQNYTDLEFMFDDFESAQKFAEMAIKHSESDVKTKVTIEAFNGEKDE